jgi:FkbM family methyltransferase
MDSPVATPKTLLRLPLGLRILQRVEFPRKLGICERIFARRLAREGVRWLRTAPGPVWKLDLANPTHRWIAYGSYESVGWWRWVRANASELGTIVDSGANIGQTVLYFAHWLPKARIFAYEPGREAREWLTEGVGLNKFENVTVLAPGLGSVPRAARLRAVGDADFHGSWNEVTEDEGEAITIVTLDEQLDRHAIPRLDLWKLDIEGHELEALRGAAAALAQGRIRAIFMEVGSSGDESVSYLRSHGYTPWQLRASGSLAPLARVMRWDNALFLAPGHPCAPRP